jgi:hypothetical protein
VKENLLTENKEKQSLVGLTPELKLDFNASICGSFQFHMCEMAGEIFHILKIIISGNTTALHKNC